MASIAARPFFACLLVACSTASLSVLPGSRPVAAQSAVQRASAYMPLNQAREYMVHLINRDRASQGQPPVKLDATACSIAQSHSDEMAQYAYVSHWDLDGRKPDQRFCESGGAGAVFENVYTNHRNPYLGYKNSLYRNALVARREIDAAQSWLFNQVPPEDRHRKNILDPKHTLVGIGISLAFDKRLGPRITLAQEFVHSAAQLKAPFSMSPGQERRLTGKVAKGATLVGVQLCREGLPKPMSPGQLNSTASYNLPDSTVFAYRAGSGAGSPISIEKTAQGEEFTFDLKSERTWKDGLYYLVVWVEDPGGTPYVGATSTMRIFPYAERIEIARVTPREVPGLPMPISVPTPPARAQSQSQSYCSGYPGIPHWDGQTITYGPRPAVVAGRAYAKTPSPRKIASRPQSPMLPVTPNVPPVKTTQARSAEPPDPYAWFRSAGPRGSTKTIAGKTKVHPLKMSDPGSMCPFAD